MGDDVEKLEGDFVDVDEGFKDNVAYVGILVIMYDGKEVGLIEITTVGVIVT